MVTRTPPTPWTQQLDTNYSAVEQYWLTRPGALTAGLRQVGTLQLKQLDESIATVHDDEAAPLQLEPGQQIWVRHIVMLLNQQPAIFARSLTPLAASTTTWQAMRHLSERPLADILYNNPNIRRSHFEHTRLDPTLSLSRALARYTERSIEDLLARSSVFFQDGDALMVNEVFLPEFWALLSTHPSALQCTF